MRRRMWKWAGCLFACACTALAAAWQAGTVAWASTPVREVSVVHSRHINQTGAMVRTVAVVGRMTSEVETQVKGAGTAAGVALAGTQPDAVPGRVDAPAAAGASPAADDGRAGAEPGRGDDQAAGTLSPAPLPPARDPSVRVLVIGASVARGWRDEEGGYMDRAFRWLSAQTRVPFVVYNRAIPGALAGGIAADYPRWLEEVRPDLVVIAWGTLNDAAKRTPVPVFRDAVAWQMEMALAHGAKVLVVTPPVSKASYTAYKDLQPQYLQAELDVVQSLRSPDVAAVDVFHAMKDYLAENHLPYQPLMADAWHPNAAGHELAAEFLERGMLRQFTHLVPVRLELSARKLAAIRRLSQEVLHQRIELPPGI
ncbi:hypothetical protein GCM10010885_12420 [Alicyclobacillus cellulosilyticus]|uniref:SGNH hydrolase-type esterase domain-containing protein n=1 Tax=Alicyclobacillus cellulosilyticus TaxID=1003997 RepID=A0A917KA01_9BACL|nr:SGNH/GDSL hydrolase family protein [Alicyclobacillus cellulosilyticus]GGJ04798.1 hypothetical protein GCM10010885_12420 [Alicyclobacillus cellulosilyticus]